MTLGIPVALYMLFNVYVFPDQTSAEMEMQALSMMRSKNSTSPREVISKAFAGNEASLRLELAIDKNNTLITGRQFASVVIHSKACPSPSFSVQLVGEALVSVPFVEVGEYSQSLWLGEFIIPIPGTYFVDLRWLGCSSEDSNSVNHSDQSELTKLEIASSSVGLKYSHGNIFADSLWLSKRLVPTIANDDRFSEYVWLEPESLLGADKQEYIHLSNSNVSIAKHGTLTDRGMYKFSQLGNYEIVCFWGGDTMYRIRELFLQEKKILSSGQRPFKFHYYNVTHFQSPDRDWDQSDKERCRKCKHIFLSIDDIEPLSQNDFEEQFVTFVLHLQRLMNDSTFPLWVLSESVASPMNRAINCHEPLKYPRSSDHPCNEVLKALFHIQPSPFQERVHFLDNTDLVLPTLSSAVSKDTVLANIALRILVAVGKGVADWRSMHQAGKSDGLHRNGTIEPNFELIPYDWSAPLSM